MSAIEANGLTKTFPVGGRRGRRTVEAVRGITFGVEPGERVAYIGPNGAGKSTSIKMLTGVLHPTDGKATVLGLVPWRSRQALARRIGTLFGQRSQLWFELPPRRGFRLLAAIYGVPEPRARQRVDELAELLDAGDLFDVPVRKLSLGQRMRCELAASLLHEPEVLFLDEPTIGLDLLGKQRFRDLVVRVNTEQGATIFLTSHDVADVEHVARRVIVISAGGIIYDDRVSSMRRTLLATKLVEVAFDGPPGQLEVAGADVVKRSATAAKLVVDTTRRSVRDVLDDLLDRYPVADISVTDPPLEQVIAEIYATPR